MLQSIKNNRYFIKDDMFHILRYNGKTIKKLTIIYTRIWMVVKLLFATLFKQCHRYIKYGEYECKKIT